jgi:hypothetical protein
MPRASFALIHEGRQLAEISYYDGVQHMILAVQPKEVKGVKLFGFFLFLHCLKMLMLI